MEELLREAETDPRREAAQAGLGAFADRVGSLPVHDLPTFRSRTARAVPDAHTLARRGRRCFPRRSLRIRFRPRRCLLNRLNLSIFRWESPFWRLI